MWLLCLVAAAAMALAGGSGFTPYAVAATLVVGALSIGASGTFNHVLERDVDKRMQRTNDRPLATDLVPVSPTRSRSGNPHARLGRPVLDGESADGGARTDRCRVLQRRVPLF